MLSGILVRIKTFTNFSVNSSVLMVVAASNIPIKEMYVSKPVKMRMVKKTVTAAAVLYHMY